MSSINEADFDSPGFEYLRSFQSMANLYLKLIALNYQREFCLLYKCPTIHRYYFSIPNKNQNEQQFMFTCLSAWLIKHKCQMNLELEPEEYEDPNLTLNTITEAIRLLVIPDYDGNRDKRDSKVMKGFQSSRLKQGYGPEVIWTLNILADRALELSLDERLTDDNRKNRFVFKSKTSGTGRATGLNSITIGQPIVGGGLTTRPLGNYQIDDENLRFEDGSQNLSSPSSDIHSVLDNKEVDEDLWLAEVDRVRPILKAALTDLEQEYNKFENLPSFLGSFLMSKKVVNEFQKKSSSLLNTIVNRIDRHLQVISSRENFIQINMKTQIEDFLKIWRQYILQLNRNKNLTQQVDVRTDKFESFNEKLRDLNSQYDTRIKELSDGSKLKELELLLNKLNEENAEFDMKIGLLLIAYARVHTRIVSRIQYDTR